MSIEYKTFYRATRIIFYKTGKYIMQFNDVRQIAVQLYNWGNNLTDYNIFVHTSLFMYLARYSHVHLQFILFNPTRYYLIILYFPRVCVCLSFFLHLRWNRWCKCFGSIFNWIRGKTPCLELIQFFILIAVMFGTMNFKTFHNDLRHSEVM